jgi:N6-L-threonylcarbamoyladenine synthase
VAAGATNKKNILAIESSCDDTAASVLVGNIVSNKPSFVIKSSVFRSQIPLHRKTGGVVPEVAARAHLQNILPVVDLALEKADCKLADIDYVAVTSGPGLVVSLVVGVEFAKGLAYAAGIPLLPVNHMAGHLYSAFANLSEKDKLSRSKAKLGRGAGVKFPVLALVVSGGHTMLLVMQNYYEYKVIGQTVDDAVGEAFDKVARLLGLPYPGGPEISRLAKQGKATIPFPRPMLHEKNYNFSFSGLKTAVLRYIQEQPKKLTKKQKANIAASFEEAAIDVLIRKALRAAKEYKCKTVALAGGVAANEALRERLSKIAVQEKMSFAMPPFELCMDNAAMIAIAAYFGLRGRQKPQRTSSVKADPSWELK